jgi:hypothetical protein
MAELASALIVRPDKKSIPAAMVGKASVFLCYLRLLSVLSRRRHLIVYWIGIRV